MNHLPRPISIEHVRVGFHARRGIYQPGDFFALPEKYNLQYTNLQDYGIDKVSGVAKEFLQSWLYFALLAQFLNTNIDTTEFLDTRYNTVHTGQLRDLLQKWIQREKAIQEEPLSLPRDTYSRIALAQRAFEYARRFVKKHLSHGPMDEENLDAGMERSPMPPRFITSQQYQLQLDVELEKLALSLAVLGEALQQAREELRIALNGKSHLWEPFLAEETSWGCSAHCRRLLKDKGWCPKDIHKLESTLGGVSFMYYTCGLKAPNDDFYTEISSQGKHAECTVSKCTAIPAKKPILHVGGCDGACRQIWAPFEEDYMIDEIKAGRTPLITFGPQKGIICKGYDLSDPAFPFGVLSHVWQDRIIHTGLDGDSSNNRFIHRCQIELLQETFNREVEKPWTEDGNVPFWIDLLCVPRQATFLGTALNATKDIYFNAHATLVWDRSLLEDSVSRNDIERNIRIRISAWATRMWTFSETVLSRNLLFEFKNRTTSLKKIIDARNEARNRWEDPYHFIWRAGHPFSSNTYDLRQNVLSYRENRAPVSIFGRVQLAWESVQFREVSNPADETRVLAHVLGLSIPYIMDIEDIDGNESEQAARRMVTFLDLLDKEQGLGIPSEIIFLPGPFLEQSSLKETKGYGWAPKSWLTRQAYSNPLFNSMRTAARRHQEGLLVWFPGLLLHCPAQGSIERIFHVPVEPTLRQWFEIALVWPATECKQFWDDNVNQNTQPAIIMSNRSPATRWEMGLLVLQKGHLARGEVRWVEPLCRIWYRLETKPNFLARLIDDVQRQPNSAIIGERLNDDTEWCIDGSGRSSTRRWPPRSLL